MMKGRDPLHAIQLVALGLWDTCGSIVVWIRSSGISGVSEDHLRQVRAAPRLSVGRYLYSLHASNICPQSRTAGAVPHHPEIPDRAIAKWTAAAIPSASCRNHVPRAVDLTGGGA